MWPLLLRGPECVHDAWDQSRGWGWLITARQVLAPTGLQLLLCRGLPTVTPLGGPTHVAIHRE